MCGFDGKASGKIKGSTMRSLILLCESQFRLELALVKMLQEIDGRRIDDAGFFHGIFQFR